MIWSATERMSVAVARMTAMVQVFRRQVTGGGATVKTVPAVPKVQQDPEVTDWIPLGALSVHEPHCVGAGCACSTSVVRS